MHYKYICDGCEAKRRRKRRQTVARDEAQKELPDDELLDSYGPTPTKAQADTLLRYLIRINALKFIPDIEHQQLSGVQDHTYHSQHD